MINIPKLPRLPEKEELEFKEKIFFQTLYEHFQNTSRIWFGLLLTVIIAAFPLKFVLESGFAKYYIENYRPPYVNTKPYTPEDLRPEKVQILPVTTGVYSVYVQIVNPNPEISARKFDYRFVIADRSGKAIKEASGESHILAGESKFLLVPSLSLATPPVSAELKITNINWTRAQPKLQVRLEDVQQNSGKTPEDKFFVEGIVRNLQGFGLKKVDVGVLVFDRTNRNIIAVNSTNLTDLKQFESRYFRVIWPTTFNDLGQIQIFATLDPLSPGLILEEPEKIPVR